MDFYLDKFGLKYNQKFKTTKNDGIIVQNNSY